MCFAQPKVDTRIPDLQIREAAEARQREEERQARIRAGTGSIDTAFGGFNDAFYADRRNAYTGFYQPQLTDQFEEARKKLTYALARAGTLNSSIAAENSAKLGREYDTNRAIIQSKAEEDVNALQSRIGSEKTALVSQLNATGDADRVSNEALARTAQMYQTIPPYNMFPDIFLGVAQGIGGIAQNQQNQAYLRAAGLDNPRRAASTTVW